MNRFSLPILVLLSMGCAHTVRRFPDADPLWVDRDEQPLATPPESNWSGLVWDGVDQTVFRPTTRALALDVAGPAANVNAYDEVPDSSWFTNRPHITPEQAARGSCTDAPLDVAGPWTVTAAKPNGANPGFIIRGPQGRGWLLKFDGLEQPERATAADVIGSRVYYAAGYFSPCNLIVEFNPAILQMAPDARGQDALGRDRPLEQADVEAVLAAGVPLPDGRLRASASLFLPGRPLGPWRYQGVRKDDPNDVIPHEDRRELRGARLLAAWLNHFDAREQNTLSVWISRGEVGFVRHYYLDFGDTLGSMWEEQGDDFSRRFGFSYYFDVGDVLLDYATLGLVRRPWEDLERSQVAPMLGFFGAEPFDPARWKPGYPNPAFNRMQPEDGAWMARILARFSDAHLAAMVDEAHLSHPEQEAELLRILGARRDKLLQRYLLLRSPLADFHLEEGTRLCFSDLAADASVVDADTVRYQYRAYTAPFKRPEWQGEQADTCLDLSRADMPAGGDGYLVLDIIAVGSGGVLPPARLHLYDHGDQGYHLVGVERPANDGAPGR